MVCRYEESIVKAALRDQAMEAAAGLDAEARYLRQELRDAESVDGDARATAVVAG